MMMDFLNILLPLIQNYLGLTQKQDENQLTPFVLVISDHDGLITGANAGHAGSAIKKTLCKLWSKSSGTLITVSAVRRI